MDNFKEEVLAYSRKNLVKITTYVEKVFAVEYMTDQVRRDWNEKLHIIILCTQSVPV